MKCPTCGANDAYVGFSTAECPNPLCIRFSPKQLESVIDERFGQGGEVDNAFSDVPVLPKGILIPVDGKEVGRLQ